MVKIGKIPILEHIINICFKYKIEEIIILLGYKGDQIKKYFKNKKYSNQIQFVNTGLKTLTGGRLKRLESYINDGENFFFTYGDGISTVNLKKLLNFILKIKELLL